MKFFFPLLFGVILILLTTTSNAQSTSQSKRSISAMDGAWVSAENDDFIVVSNGFYSEVGKDSTGRWNATHAGTYVIDNANTATFKATYSSSVAHIGTFHTIGFQMNGDTLTVTWFKKLVDAKGVDMTNQMEQGTVTKYVRAKR